MKISYKQYRFAAFSIITGILLMACNLPQVTLTPSPIPATFTPQTTPTYPCPVPTQELPPQVNPVASPTDLTTQEIVISGNFDSATVRSESGEFSGKRDPNTGKLVVKITLLPNTTHHLDVTGHVPLNTWNNCSYGGYDMSVVIDYDGNPLTIVQGVPATPAASTEIISPKNINRLSQLAALDGKTMMSGFVFAGDFELLTFGFGQANTRWLIPALTRTGVIGTDGPQLPAPVSADYFPRDIPTVLAIGSGGNPGGAEEFSVKIYNLANDTSRFIGGHSGSVSAIAFNPSGTLLASAANDDAVRIWDTQSGGKQAEFNSGRQEVMESFYCLHWTDDATLWAGGDHALYQINAKDGGLINSIVLDGNYGCGFSADGHWFAATNQDLPLKLVNLQSGELKILLPYSPDQYPGYLVDAAISPDGQLVAAINTTGMWFIWDTQSGQVLVQQAASLSDGYHIEFSLEGRYLAVSGWKSPVVQLWGIR